MGGCERAVSLCVFACDTARGVRFGQYSKAVLHFALPVGRESGSTEGQFCNLYCLRVEILAVLEKKMHLVLLESRDIGSTREENVSSTA